MCVYIIFCLQSPSNQSFYRHITGYGMSVSDHRGSQMTKGDHGQTNQIHSINWGVVPHAPQLMSWNYYVCVHVCITTYMNTLIFVC